MPPRSPAGRANQARVTGGTPQARSRKVKIPVRLQDNTALDAGALGGAPILHALLSGTHNDTLLASPVRGDLIVANASALWGRKAKGAIGTAFIMGADDPAWTAIPTQTSLLLSAVHTDTTPAACVRGDVIIGSGVTPTWTRLAKSTPGYVFTMGADEPGWAAPAAPAAHQLDGAVHTVSGLTAGHFLKALTPTTFGFAVHGLTAADVGAAPSAHGHAWADVSKVGSSLSDLATRAVANLSDGSNVALLSASNTFLANQQITVAGSTWLWLKTTTNNIVQAALQRDEGGGSYNVTWNLYVPASSTDFRIQGAGSDWLTITAAGVVTIPGNVGIGIVPLDTLQVKSAANVNAIFRLQSKVGGSATTMGLHAIVDNSATFIPLAIEATSLQLNAVSGGFVGIRTPTPGEALDVVNTIRTTSTAAATAIAAGDRIGSFIFYGNDDSGGGQHVAAQIDAYAENTWGAVDNGQGQLRFSTYNGASLVERIRVLAGGLITMIAPVQGQGAIRSIGGDVTGATGPGLELMYNAGGGYGHLAGYNRTAGAYIPVVIDGSVVMISIAGAEKVRIDGSGYVGFATTTPQTIAHFIGEVTFGNVAHTGWRTAAIAGINEGAAHQGALAFYTHPNAGGPGAPTERARITSAGYFGVGTTPLELFHIHDPGTSAYLRLTDSTLGNTYGAFIRGYGVAAEGGHADIGVVNAGGKTVAITINEAGLVGMGTPTPNVGGYPSTVLTVCGAGAAYPYAAIELGQGGADADGALTGFLSFVYPAQAATYRVLGWVGTWADNPGTATKHGGNMRFATQPDNTAGPVERMRIASGGGIAMFALGGFAAGDCYVIIDASGNLHKSALGPAS
jgi:hypothetical protein